MVALPDSTDEAWVDSVADWSRPIDTTKLFVCPTLTPLYYTSTYRQWSDFQRLRYNQLSAISFIQLIVFFEKSFAGALEAMTDSVGCDRERKARIDQFLADERRHCAMWRRLERGCSPKAPLPTVIHDKGHFGIMIRLLTAFPKIFPVDVLTMLTLEEHSIEISRRCGRLDIGELEPHFASAYRAHLLDETRHVQIDRQLLQDLVQSLSPTIRRLNAAMFRWFIRTLWLRPRRAAARVLSAMIQEFPELKASRERALLELAGLEYNSDYRSMMFSATTLPMTFSFLHSHPDFWPGEGWAS